jgi:hypothetical protein
MTECRAKQTVDWNRIFRWAAMLFAVAVAVHAVDHLRRGVDILPAAVTVALVLLGNRWAPHAAIFIGFVSAIGFTVAHLLPTWDFFSDSFIKCTAVRARHLVLMGDRPLRNLR